jgi:hypothetical protein
MSCASTAKQTDATVQTSEEDFEIIQNSKGTITIVNYVGESQHVVIPSIIGNVEVTEIDNRAFSNKNLLSVFIPEGIITVGKNAFSHNSGITTLIIPNSVKTIEESAFSSNQLKSLTFGNQLTTIGNDAFSYNQLKEVNIPPSVTTIGNDAFATNPLERINIPSSVTRIGNYAFDGNNFLAIEIGANKAYVTTSVGFEESFVNFYINAQNRRAGTYVKNGRIWSLK